jgi:hypothetical protein
VDFGAPGKKVGEFFTRFSVQHDFFGRRESGFHNRQSKIRNVLDRPITKSPDHPIARFF